MQKISETLACPSGCVQSIYSIQSVQLLFAVQVQVTAVLINVLPILLLKHIGSSLFDLLHDATLSIISCSCLLRLTFRLVLMALVIEVAVKRHVVVRLAAFLH